MSGTIKWGRGKPAVGISLVPVLHGAFAFNSMADSAMLRIEILATFEGGVVISAIALSIYSLISHQGAHYQRELEEGAV